VTEQRTHVPIVEAPAAGRNSPLPHPVAARPPHPPRPTCSHSLHFEVAPGARSGY